RTLPGAGTAERRPSRGDASDAGPSGSGCVGMRMRRGWGCVGMEMSARQRAGDDLDQDDEDEGREVEPTQWRKDPSYRPEHRLGDLVEEAVDAGHRRTGRDREPTQHDPAENQ